VGSLCLDSHPVTGENPRLIIGGNKVTPMGSRGFAPAV
jgi:hypothetical protein